MLVSTSDPVTYERLSIIRHGQRLELVPLATDLDYFGVIYRAADADGTGVAFSLRLVGGNGRFRAYVTDANLPGISLPLGSARTDDEEVYVFAALGAPLPSSLPSVLTDRRRAIICGHVSLSASLGAPADRGLRAVVHGAGACRQ